ncbi:WAT1-related protein [Striga hermonthica]|uniref:WAT1-related protein n=1 Tax=Striga hermonthica TaxID=68872 RepID=A0A9N7R2H6_STRHE|nr:WAT1-related protein [Striga hermonthica]
MSLNLHYVALNYISATFATAVTNTIPAMVFIIAVLSRIENLAIRKKHGWAKVLGSVLGISGAMVFTFYKGPYLYSGSNNEAHNLIARSYSKEEWIKGSLLLLGSNLTWSIWLVMQAPILKEYPAKLRLTTLQCGFSCLVSAVYGAIKERDISSWKLGWNINLLSVAYSGIVVSAINYSMQVWVVEKKGPVFTAIFSPLALVLTALFSAILFHESLYWGNVLGGGMLVAGLYAFLWGLPKGGRSGYEMERNEMKKVFLNISSAGGSDREEEGKVEAVGSKNQVVGWPPWRLTGGKITSGGIRCA